MPHFSPIPMIALLLSMPASAEPLNVVSWGGAYEGAQREAIFDPYSRQTGEVLKIHRYAGEPDALATRATTENWDVVDMIEDQAITACERGDILPLDPAELGLDPDNFSPAPIRRCSVPHTIFATVMAYDDRRFPGVKPNSIEDFFDPERFPGARALEKRPDVILEWALLAEGVPAIQVYDLLSTERGLDLAFRKLDRIRDDIIWWEDPAEAAEMLADGRAVMASGYNGRFFALKHEEEANIAIIWDGRIISNDAWAIPTSSRRKGAAKSFIAFAARPEPMAALASRIPYGPSRPDAFERIGLNPLDATPMRPHLPNAPEHGSRMLVRDSEWYAHTHELRTRRFHRWLSNDR